MYHGEIIKKTKNDLPQNFRWCSIHGEIPIIKFYEDKHALCIQKPKNGGSVETEGEKAFAAVVGKTI